MKVLLLPSWYPNKDNPLDGVFFKEQAEALSRRNLEVIVLSINIISLSRINKTKMKRGLTIAVENGVKVYRYNTFNYFPRLTEYYLRYYSKLMKKLVRTIELEEKNIDFIHIHSAIDAGIAYHLSGLNIPYVITEHSSKYQRNILNKTQIKYLSEVFNNARQVISVGQGLKDAISKYVDKDKIKVIPNLVSFKEEDTDIEKEKSKFRFFSLGVLTKTKGMDLLIDAFNNKRNELENCELYIGGDGIEFENLKVQIDKSKLSDKIKLLGALNRNEVAYQMNNCDAFVLASRFETFGIVFIEAMLYGKPVIGTRTGGPDTFINEENGILVNVEDIDALENALVAMYKQHKKYNGQNIISYCKDNFSEEAVCNRILDIYNDII